jgi:hypothetical protein
MKAYIYLVSTITLIIIAAFILPGSALAAINSGPSCVSLNRSLSVGSTGSDVSNLQRFLVAQNYPGGGSWMVTGYYGLATQVSIQNFQLMAGLTQTGSVDNATRSSIQSHSCGTAYQNDPYNSGVVLGASTGPNYNQYTYPYNYNQYGYNTNTYQYETGIVLGSSVGPTTQSCTYYNCSNQTINVTSLSKNSGAPGEYITVYGVGFTENNNTVHFGNGIVPFIRSNGTSLSFEVPSTISGFGSGSLQLQTYDVYVTNSYGQNSNRHQFTVTSGAGSGSLLTVYGAGGPNTLDVNESGTWSMNIFGPSFALAEVEVVWGDEYQQQNTQTTKQSFFLDTNGTKSVNFSHTYSQNGIYSPTFIVSNSSGSHSTSNTVIVGTGVGTSALALNSISPSSDTVGSQVILYGSGFSAYGNTVHFSYGGSVNVPSISNGTAIHFTIPEYISPCDTLYSACSFSPISVTQGTYPISVTNGSNTTQTINFSVTN